MMHVYERPASSSGWRSPTRGAQLYDPYGTGGVDASYATSPFWLQNPYGFKAGTRTSAGQNTLVKFGLRWYLAGVGNWTQEDTLDSPLDPSNADRYAYAGSDPANHGHPDGRSLGDTLGKCFFHGLIGAAVGAIGDPETLGVSSAVGFAIGCGASIASSYVSERYGERYGSDVEVGSEGADLLELGVTAAEVLS